MWKKCFALLLSLTLCLALLPATAFAADSDFDIQDGVLINYFGPDEDVTIPNSVTTIGQFVFTASYVTSVTIPSRVTEIGD